MMRILYSSNAPWCNTGYGVQSKSLLPRLGALDVVGGPENIGLFAWFGVQGGMTQVGPHVVYPGHAHPYGTDVIGKHAQHFGAEVVITLIDVWTQRGVGELVAPAKWLPWFPIDAEPLGRIMRESLAGAHLPLVYSRFGERVLGEAGIECAYVPHGIEPAVFCILDDRAAVAQFRAEMAGPECEHLAVMVAANKGFPDRKAFGVQLRAWAAFAAERPTARLYVHTDPTTQAGGADLVELTRVLGIEGRVIFPDRYSYYLGYPAEYLAMVYNAADVLLAATMCEGFGIPIIEAQACGCPAIVTDYSSMPELLCFGRKVDARDIAWSEYGTWWAIPDWEQIVEELELLERGPADQRALAERTASHCIHNAYGWDTVVERYWRPVLERVAA